MKGTNFEKMSDANYIWVCYLPRDKYHILYNQTTHGYEIWFANKNHASWGLLYKNTHLEFIRDISDGELDNYLETT